MFSDFYYETNGALALLFAIHGSIETPALRHAASDQAEYAEKHSVEVADSGVQDL
jgi:hypothetical protein